MTRFFRRTRIGILALVTALAAPASGRTKVPDVVPGEGWRLLRELTAGPLRFRIYQSGTERSLTFAVASSSTDRKWIGPTLDDGHVGDPGLGGDPGALSVSVQPVDGPARELFLVHVNTAPGAAAKLTTASHFLVRREKAQVRLVCRLPDEPTEISILETAPALIFEAGVGGDRVRFVARNNDLCELARSDQQSPTSAKLLFEATVAQAEMFRTAEVWKKAGDAFQRALYLRSTGRDAEWLARSAIDMRSGYNDLLWECTANRSVEELPIRGAAKLLLESYDDYLSFFPTSQDAPQVHYRKGDLLEACHHFETAAQQYKQVIESSPNSELGQFARQRYELTVEMARQRGQKEPATNPLKSPADHPSVQPAGPGPRRPTP